MKFDENIITTYKHKLIDFTDCESNIKNYEYSSMQKNGVIYNEEPYLLKHMEKNKARHYKHLPNNNETYFNSIYSEYISCHIGKMIGLNIQDTFIGYTKEDNINNETEYIPCVACKDFCKDYEILISFEKIIQNVITKKENKQENKKYDRNNFYDILEIIDKQSFIDKQQLKEWFLDMFVFDSFIGNFDRNLKNFGIIKNTIYNTYKIAPIFDCASSLHPKTSREQIKKLYNVFQDFNSNKIIEQEALYKPFSYFTEFVNHKINYYDFLINKGFYGNLDIAEAICRITPRIIHIVTNNELDDLLSDVTDIIPNERLNIISAELNHKIKYMMIPMLKLAYNILDIDQQHNILQTYLKEYSDAIKSSKYLISNINNTLDCYYILDNIKSNLPLNIQEKYNYLTQDYVYSIIDQFMQNLLTEESAVTIKNLLIKNKVYPEYIHHFDSIIDDPQYYKK